MSKVREPTNPQGQRDSPRLGPNNNPFRFPLDQEHTADEWWNEEGTVEARLPEPATASHITQWWNLGNEVEVRPSEPLTASRITQWPRPPEGTGLGLYINKPPTDSIRRVDRRYSVQKPTQEKSRGRQRVQNVQAGIKVVTDFTRKQPTEPAVLVGQQAPPPAQPRFVELKDLEALENQPAEKSDKFWRFRKGKIAGKSYDSIRSHWQGGTSRHAHARKKSSKNESSRPREPNPQAAPGLEPGDDLSPNDRPIVIGISIPSTELTRQVLDPQTATSERARASQFYENHNPGLHVPTTPTILVTPAEQNPWPRPNDQNGSPMPYIRPTSSVYSHTTDISHAHDGMSTSPHIPVSFLGDERQMRADQESYFSPDSDNATTWDDDNLDSASETRPSSCTVFEEDESPIIARTGRAVSISAGSKVKRPVSTSTVATYRRSRGWWNYITTPFLSRSSTFTTRDAEDQPRPALPSLAIAAVKAQEAERDASLWEKQFSPATPKASATPISDSWLGADIKHPLSSTQSPVLQETRHKVQTSMSTLGTIVPETATFGSVSVPSLQDGSESQPDNSNASVTSSRASGVDLNLKVVPMPITPSNLEETRNNHSHGEPQPTIINNCINIHPLERPAAPSAPTSRFSAPRKDSQSSIPPPPYSPAYAQPRLGRYRAAFPPGHTLATQYPASPGPLSPEMQEAMSSRGAIPMSDVPLTPATRRPINLNPGYTEVPAQQNTHPIILDPPPPPSKAQKAEAKRRRYEKEEAIARRAGGLWRGRGCVSNRGCYGRTGAEGRRRRRWYLSLIVGFFLMIVLVVVLATTLHRKSNTAIPPTQWLNMTGFPPIYLGLSTILAPVNPVANDGCVYPATLWSCDLPKELQSSVSPNQPNQPNFILEIQWDNSSSTNATFSNVTGNPNLETRNFSGGPVSAGQFIGSLILKARDIVTFVPSPTPPSYAEELFLGNTTDGIVSDNKAGEPTPFYISMLSQIPSSANKRQLISRQDQFPNVSTIIPSPSLNSNGTAAPANLLPFPTQQPIRLYDRGLPTEHYGFYTYFDRSIFLKSLTYLNDTNLVNGEVPDDENGGSTESAAEFRCTWSQTRFLVQMWTRMNTTTQLLNMTSVPNTANPVTSLAQPGTFPYPTTITTDRHGGDPTTKMVYCYDVNVREEIVAGTGQIQTENRGFGGVVINPAPTFFANSSDPALGGYDGGTGGCSCQWNNFKDIISL